MGMVAWVRISLVFFTFLSAFRPAVAVPITFKAASSGCSDRVEFEKIGRKLRVTLENLSEADALSASDVLTAVFFALAADPKLRPVSALAPSGDTALLGGNGWHNAVGDEWACRNSLTNAPDHADQEISVAALGLFGPKNRFA